MCCIKFNTYKLHSNQVWLEKYHGLPKSATRATQRDVKDMKTSRITLAITRRMELEELNSNAYIHSDDRSKCLTTNQLPTTKIWREKRQKWTEVPVKRRRCESTLKSSAAHFQIFFTALEFVFDNHNGQRHGAFSHSPFPILAGPSAH